MVFKKGMKKIPHKPNCQCFMCTKTVLPHNYARKGKTYDELYGKEKADAIKQKQRDWDIKHPHGFKIGNHPKTEWKKGQHFSPSTEFKKMNEEQKKQHAEKSRLRWQNQDYRERVVSSWLKSICKRPSLLEQKMTDFIKKNNLPYTYCGNGNLIIGGRCPDFYENNGKKICLEVRPKQTCQLWNKCTPEEYARKKVEHFAKYGWKCFVFFSDRYAFDEKNILETLKGENIPKEIKEWVEEEVA